MAAIFAFICSCCGKLHEGSPSFAYDAPAPYSTLSDEQKHSIAKINSDLCMIKWDDRTDYFARAILEIPIVGVEEPFTWGVWTSLSEKSFNRYVETYDEPVAGETFFGWVSNPIPHYPRCSGPAFATDVIVQSRGQRPKLRLRQDEDPAHPLIVDQSEGITVARAQEIAELLMHGRR